jgi:hypothetical protein
MKPVPRALRTAAPAAAMESVTKVKFIMAEAKFIIIAVPKTVYNDQLLRRGTIAAP